MRLMRRVRGSCWRRRSKSRLNPRIGSRMRYRCERLLMRGGGSLSLSLSLRSKREGGRDEGSRNVGESRRAGSSESRRETDLNVESRIHRVRNDVVSRLFRTSCSSEKFPEDGPPSRTKPQSSAKPRTFEVSSPFPFLCSLVSCHSFLL